MLEGLDPDRLVESNWLRTEPMQTGVNAGYAARYYGDDGSHNFDESRFLLGRRESSSSNNWGLGSPVPGMPVDNFMAKFSTYFTAPVTGSYQFGVSGDDGTRLYVNDVLSVDRWANGGAPINTQSYGSAISLTAGQSVKLRGEYYEIGGGANFNIYVQGAIPAQPIPTSYISATVNGLTNGWQMSVDADGNLAYDYAQINPGSIVFYDAGGDKKEYKWDAAKVCLSATN